MSMSREPSRNKSIFDSLVQVHEDIDFDHNHMAEGVNVVGEIQVDFQKKLGIFLISLRENYKLPSLVIPQIIKEFWKRFVTIKLISQKLSTNT